MPSGLSSEVRWEELLSHCKGGSVSCELDGSATGTAGDGRCLDGVP